MQAVRTAQAVQARGLVKTFGEVVALDGVDLDLPLGEVRGLVGPNGAGKTTLLGLLLGLSHADQGDLTVLGERVATTTGVPDGVAGFVDAPGLYPSLTARANLTAVASLRPEADITRAEVDHVLDQVGLTDVADDKVRGFSLGMRQRLGLAAALLVRPRLVILDEPANGLDPAGKRHVHRVLRRLADEGSTVIVSSHHMDDVAALCDQVTLLAAGRVVFTGTVAQLAQQGGAADYRLATSDDATARRMAQAAPGLTLVSAQETDELGRSGGGALVVRGEVQALDALVLALAEAGVAVRELGPLVPTLEAAYLALTSPTPAIPATTAGSR